MLKGSPGTTVAIRQRSGVDDTGNTIEYDTDFTRRDGQKYLLFLSKGLYTLAAAQTTGAPATGDAYYIPQRSAFEIDSNGRLQPMGKGVPAPPSSASAVISQIRALKLESTGGQ